MTTFILDTDHITLLREAHVHIYEHIVTLSADQVAATVVSFQEQVQGWLAKVRRASNPQQVAWAYQKLLETHHYFSDLRVLPFIIAAAEKFQELRSQRIRIGTQDLRIASIALTTNCVVVTRNRSDFERVPNLEIVDWTVPRN